MPIYIVLLLDLFLFIASFFVVLFLITRYKRIILSVCCLFVLVSFTIYTAGYLSSGTGFADALLATLHGIISTARMFSVDEDYHILTEVPGTQWLTENIWVQILFWFCYVSVLIIIETAFISLFGRKLLDNFRLFFGSHKEVYIIKGSDKNAFLLAENIVTHDKEKKKPDYKRLIVFLLEEDDDEQKVSEKAARFGGIVKMMDIKNNLPYYLSKTKLRKRNRLYNVLVKYKCIKEKKYNIILMPKDSSVLDDVRFIAEYAKENNIKPDNLDIFVFVSTEWDREKIEEITQAKTDNKRKYPYTFHIVNEVELLTRQMIEKYPPYECQGLNFTGSVASRDFTVMILGFGQVGQSALLRLMMNGQFVGSRMRAIIVDKDIENLRDSFLHRYPGLDFCCKTEFENINVQRKDFFKLLDKEKNVDYIVAALQGDEINKQTALDIKHHYERKGIMQKEMPFIAVAELNGSLREKKQGSDVSKKNENLQELNKNEKIFLFGCREDVYKESIIIRGETDRMAKAVNDVYKSIHGGQPWHDLDWISQESNRASADFIPAILNLAQINENEVIEKNSLTNDDSLAEVLAQTEHLRWIAFHVAMGYRPLSEEEMNKRFEKYTGVKNSEARLGFCRKDATSRLHVCLATWDELDKIKEAYQKLAYRTDSIKEQNRDFKDNDREIIMNIPKFLEAVKRELEFIYSPSKD